MKMAKFKIMLVSMLCVAGFVFTGNAWAARVIKVLNLAAEPVWAEQEIDQEFEKQFGVKVIHETYDWEPFIHKVKLEIATDGSEYDLIEYDAVISKGVVQGGLFLPLEQYMKDPNLPGLDLDNFPAGTIEAYGSYEGKVVGVPRTVVCRGYAYRKDLFEDPNERAKFMAEYGYELAFPKTWDQFGDAIEFFTRDTNGDGKVDFWGCSNGFDAGGAAFDMFEDMYITYKPIKEGGWFFDKEYSPIFNNEKAIHVLELLKKWTQAGYYSPGYLNRLWIDVCDDLGANRAALGGTYMELFSKLLRPEYEDILPQIDFAPVPVFEEERTIVSAMMYAVNKNSSLKEDAYRYLAWITSSGIDSRLVTDTKYVRMPCRLTTYQNPEVMAVIPWVRVSGEAMLTAVPWPPFLEELMFELSPIIQSVLVGELSSEEALDQATAKMKKIVERAGF